MTEYHSEDFSIELKDGIVHAIWMKEWVDYKIVDKGIQSRLAITQDKNYPMLSDIRKLKGGSREARIRLGARDGLIGLKALAVIYDNRVHLMLYKLFKLFFGEPVPTRFFRKESEAIEWLNQYK
jgi:hypothetical protein